MWAQTDELLHVRVRFARYTTGEAMARRVEQVNVTLRSGSLYVSAESALGSTPAFFETTVAWLHPLARADGCADSDTDGGEFCASQAAAGECTTGPGAVAVQARCALSCGLCAEADSPPLATWAVTEGELIIEARKGTLTLPKT